MTASDLLTALAPVVDVLEGLGVRYFVGGSVASSVHGVPRTSIDVDLVADLESRHVTPLLNQLENTYYVDEGRVRAAIEGRRSFNLIHLATMFKVDIFVSRRRPFDLEALDRAPLAPLDDAPDARRFRVASAEDAILAKLEWFRAGGEVSERQWTDVLGVLTMGRAEVDRAYLQRWAATLGVGDLMARAFDESSPGTA
ncbi:MAG: hypothetical protein ACHQNV_03925 [Vicinamibacteria bacterium]